MPEWYEVCVYCGEEIDFSGAVMVMSDTDSPSYQPFMEDWRGGYVKVAHPKCFGEREGVEPLLQAVAREDERRRGRH